MPHMAVVNPSSIISQANPPGFLVPYRVIVQMISLTSWSKKKRAVITRPGIMAPNIQAIGNSQKGTKNLNRDGFVGRNDVLMSSVCLSR